MSADELDDAVVVRRLGLTRGLDWSLDEARAIADQLTATRAGLEAARTRLDASAEEPASKFDADWGARP